MTVTDDRPVIPYRSEGEHLTEAQIMVRRMWANALRSGKYRQGNNALQANDGTFCCLGVLCDLVDHAGWRKRGLAYDDEALRITHRGGASYPDYDIQEAAGLKRKQMELLAVKNDLQGWTFNEIAAEIERGIPWQGPMMDVKLVPEELPF